MKRKKIKVTFHYADVATDFKKSKRLKYVYLENNKLLGFDLLQKKRYIQFYTKQAAEIWANDFNYKLVSKDIWKKKRKKSLRLYHEAHEPKKLFRNTTRQTITENRFKKNKK